MPTAHCVSQALCRRPGTHMASEGPRASGKWGDSVGDGHSPDSYTNTPKMVSTAGKQEVRGWGTEHSHGPRKWDPPGK